MNMFKHITAVLLLLGLVGIGANSHAVTIPPESPVVYKWEQSRVTESTVMGADDEFLSGPITGSITVRLESAQSALRGDVIFYSFIHPVDILDFRIEIPLQGRVSFPAQTVTLGLENLRNPFLLLRENIALGPIDFFDQLIPAHDGVGSSYDFSSSMLGTNKSMLLTIGDVDGFSSALQFGIDDMPTQAGPNLFSFASEGKWKFVRPVHEPSTLALIGLGLAAIGFFCKRKIA